MSTPEGLLVVDKPADWTSHDVVARCRRLCATRRVGHAGTLDPMATGVLLLGVGRATRLLGRLALADKSYDATIRLGQSTVTDDAEGDVVSSTDASAVTEADVRAGTAALTGDLQQRPAAVSAIKIKGERAYQRVRAGEQVDLAPRPVTVSQFDVLDLRRGGGTGGEEAIVDLDVVVTCSTGTYVRALARDLGAALGVGGHLTRLRRTRVGPYSIDQARPLAELEPGAVELISLAEVATQTFPAFAADVEQEQAVRHGRSLLVDLGAHGQVAVVNAAGEFLALYEQHGPVAKAVAVFAV